MNDLPPARHRALPASAAWLVILLSLALAASVGVAPSAVAQTDASESPAPTITQVDPFPGPVHELTRITVTFSKPVRGVTADDFLINGASALRVDGSGAVYSFHFNPPPFGPVEIRWGTLHAIEDLEDPPNRFEISAPGSAWGYEHIDPLGPTVADRLPPAGIEVSSLSQVRILFDKAVTGLDASDLLLGGVPATRVTGIGAGPYVFDFPAAPPGEARLTFAETHGITSDSLEPRVFAAPSWSYTVNPALQRPALRITEFMAENFTAHRDEDQDPEDWIEIHNPSTTAVDLNGWSLSNDDDDPDLWTFPSVTVPAGGRLLVYASGKDRRPSANTGRLHTNFKLNPNGGFIALHGPELPRRAVSEVTFPVQGPNHSYGRENDTGDWRYFLTGTPGAPNGTSPIHSAVGDVAFSVPRGFFQGTFQLTLSCPTPGATIRFTTNGSPPSQTEGHTYTQAIPITVSRVVRVAAFLTNALPSRTATHTYILNPSPTRLRVPALSLVTATNHLYGRNGIMEVNPRNTTKRGPAWERPVSVEWIRPEDNGGFQADCGLRIQGGDYVRGQYNYRSTDLPFSKYSFRLYFRGEYGQGRLNYPLFPETTQTSFDTVVLRAGMNDPLNPFLTDEFVRSLVRDTGQPSPAGTFVHLFLNGVYKGYYNPCERIDVDFLQAYHGGGERWDIMAQAGEVREGDATAFNALRTVATTRDLTQPANFRDIASRLDLSNFVDYLLPLIYVDNDDWPHNNWRAARERVPGAPYRMYCWDAEWAFGFVNGHGTTWDTIRNQLSNTSPPWGGADIQRIFIGLRRSPEFRLLFADRAHRLLFNNGALTDERIRTRYAALTNRLNGIVSGFNNRIATTWIPQRRRNVLLHLERAGLLASSNAPVLSRHGGSVSEGFQLTLTHLAGTILYTTNGSDPRVAFTGAVSPDARVYDGPLPILHPLVLRARSLNGTNWSAVTEAPFEVRRPGIPLVISELMYAPPGGEAFEFLELHNHGSLPVDVSGFSFTGINFRFPTPSQPIPPGARWILANNARPAEFTARYPEVTVAGWYGGALNNAGERIEILTPDGTLVTRVDYSDDPPWPVEADGSGPSLVFDDPSADPSDPAAWRASTANGGSPGQPSPAFTLPTLRFSEINPAASPDPDWIELHNAGAEPVLLEGWSLSDNQDPRRFIFPAGTRIEPGAWLRVWCGTNVALSLPGLRTSFALSANGETLTLHNPDLRRVDAVTFGPVPDGHSLGRIEPSLDWQLTRPTPLAPNQPATLADPSHLTVNEWLANPAPDQQGWIELHNTSPDAPVALRGLHIGTSNHLARLRGLAFVPPAGFVVLQTTDTPGPTHLPFSLPANAGAIRLADADGEEFHRVTYRLPMDGLAVGVEGVTLGRIPDGTGPVVALPGSASPAASNYRAPTNGPRFHEFMASNNGAVRHPSGRPSDWLELHNNAPAAFDLSGTRITLEPGFASGWVFPTGTVIAPGGFLLVWCDPGLPPTTTADPHPNLARGLPAEGATLRLIDPSGRTLDTLTYGAQLTDVSAGRTAFDSWALLTQPTPGAPNTAAAPLGNPSDIRINEWMAGRNDGEDWIELHNPQGLPLDLGGFHLTDDPSIAGIARFRIAPLTFIPARRFLVWNADARPDRGPDHLPYQLDPRGRTLRLYAANRSLVDSMSYPAQPAGTAAGRFPDGAARNELFATSESPGEGNWLAHPDVVVSEVLSRTDPPLEDAIELLNLSARPLSLEGWWLSDASDALDKYRIPAGRILPPGGRLVLYEADFNAPGMPTAFALDAARGDDVWLSETDANGQPTGFRAHARFGAAAQGVSFGRHPTSTGWDFPPLSRRTFGIDEPVSLEHFRQGTGLPNAYPLVGPVVVSEIHFDPLGTGPAGPVAAPEDEFVELHNLGTTPVPLFHPQFPANTWRLRGGIDFDLPPDVVLPPGGFALVIRWHPDSPEALAFRDRHALPDSVILLGPFAGRLSDDGEEIRLERPDSPQQPPAPDAGFVPYLLVERIDYRPSAPWPVRPPGTNTSLQRRRAVEYANDPAHWIAATPSPGTPTRPPTGDRDLDGLPDAWESAYGLDPDSPDDADLDSDGDGLSNRAEYLAGTNPRDPRSSLALSLARDGTSQLVLRFQAMAHRTYTILRREEVGSGVWQRVADLPPDPADREAAVPIGAPESPAAFLRVVTPAQP